MFTNRMYNIKIHDDLKNRLFAFQDALNYYMFYLNQIL